LNGSYKRGPDDGSSEAETCCLIDLYIVFCLDC